MTCNFLYCQLSTKSGAKGSEIIFALSDDKEIECLALLIHGIRFYKETNHASMRRRHPVRRKQTTALVLFEISRRTGRKIRKNALVWELDADSSSFPFRGLSLAPASPRKCSLASPSSQPPATTKDFGTRNETNSRPRWSVQSHFWNPISPLVHSRVWHKSETIPSSDWSIRFSRLRQRTWLRGCALLPKSQVSRLSTSRRTDEDSTRRLFTDNKINFSFPLKCVFHRSSNGSSVAAVWRVGLLPRNFTATRPWIPSLKVYPQSQSFSIK